MTTSSLWPKTSFALSGHTFNTLPLSRQHLSELLAVESSAHATPWRRSDFEGSLERHHCIGVFDGTQRLCAYAVMSLVVDEAELLLFVVASNWQGKGLGKQFLLWLLEHLPVVTERVFLELRDSNHRALALYESCGFHQIGHRPNYYPAAHGREDAILMAIEVLP